jgi:ankyrin repeat protein
MDRPAVRLASKTLPNDLNETYDRILRNIPHICAPNAIKLLQLLINSRRPLLLAEVVDVVATEPEIEPPFLFENRIDPPEAIIGYCPSLVRLTTTLESGYSDGPEDGHIARTTIQLAHFSVQEYLLLDRKESPYLGSFAGQAANAKITQICLAYLWATAEAEHGIAEFPLAAYAARHWLHHARIAGDSDEITFAWTNRIFSEASKPLIIAGYKLRCWQVDAFSENSYHFSELALYQVSLGDLYRSAKHLLEAGADVNGSDAGYPSPLQGACSSGSIETIQLLIDHGADVNPQTRSQNPLLWAVRTQNVEVLHLILENGADVDATDGHRTALFQASESGHPELVHMLLDYGANVNLDSGSEDTLQEACKRVFPEITSRSPQDRANWVKIFQNLLDRDAHVNLHLDRTMPVRMGVRGTNAMEIVQLLLTHNTDVNMEGGWYGRPICAAAHSDSKQVLQVLLDRGADVNARSGRYGCALLSACHPQFGRIDGELVQLLLDNGADPNASEEYYGNALCVASKHGDVEVVETLLRGGADVNAVGAGNCNALSIAARRDHVKVLQLLLDKGAISNTSGRPYHDILEDCVKKRQVDVARILFEEGSKRQLEVTNASHPRLKKVSYLYLV